MRHFANALTAIACMALAAILFAAPAGAQTSGGSANNPPAAYGNSGFSAAGRRSRTHTTYREEMPRSGRTTEVNTITDAGETVPRSGVPPSGRIPPAP